MRTVDQSLWLDMYAHALAEYPKEAVGLVVDGHVQNLCVFGTFVPLRNVHENPTEHYRIPKSAIEFYAGRITALWHSHPDEAPAPSAHDMITQMNWKVPSIIVSTDGSNCLEPFAWGDELGILPLENRIFRSGVTDCVAAIRDHFRLNLGITWKDTPRDWGWWNRGQNLYIESYGPAGFHRLRANSPEELLSVVQPNDVFMLAMRSNVPNHGGVYLGDGLIYHHLGSERGGAYSPVNRSTVESAMRWMDYRPIVLRYGLNEDDPSSRDFG